MAYTTKCLLVICKVNFSFSMGKLGTLLAHLVHKDTLAVHPHHLLQELKDMELHHPLHLILGTHSVLLVLLTLRPRALLHQQVISLIIAKPHSIQELRLHLPLLHLPVHQFLLRHHQLILLQHPNTQEVLQAHNLIRCLHLRLLQPPLQPQCLDLLLSLLPLLLHPHLELHLQ